ncbi:hypothetical protein ACFWC5_21565 [Streptomyces sp. NPDC060085]|uniref:hypothetical protein n=1 Tax=Streptomyces sp. NPDC060085 TaxID=3347054 RepID=UPI003651F72B
MSPIEAATDDLQDLAVLWSIGEAHAHDVVEAACAALVAGLDSPALCILAGLPRAEAEYDVPDLLPVVLDELATARPGKTLPCGRSRTRCWRAG